MRATVNAVFACVLLIAPARCVWAAEVDFGSLLEEMTDLGRLALFPDPPYVTRQCSSYDRASTDSAVLTDENWFANGDRGQFLREEQHGDLTEYVMMDAEGPGVIVRIWSADPDDAGHIRIYFDGNPDPAIDMPLSEMLGGAKEPFLSPIAGTRARGWNSYLPIPYAKHCKVTATQRDFYYHINYRAYPAGVDVETFSLLEAKDERRKLQNAVACLASPSTTASRISGRGEALTTSGENELVSASTRGHVELAWNSLVAPGEVRQVERLTGAGALYQLSARLDPAEGVAITDAAYDQALRQVVLEITFDGTGVPQVSVPLGDFFGAMPGVRPYDSLPITVSADGTMAARWVMPFQREAVIRLHNVGDAVAQVHGKLAAAPNEWTHNSLYFHAGWHAGHDLPTRPRQDWTFLETTGTGRFVGVAFTITNPVPDWWGEGDEKIYVDGESFPSTFGTGTEDYFGYAWGDTTIFSHAYHNQPRMDGPGRYGHTTLNRFHIIDDIPFHTSFRFDMEVWHWSDAKIAQAVTAYWYAAPNGVYTPSPVTAEAVRIPELAGAKKVAGALEGEQLTVAEVTGGTTQVQSGMESNWSDWAQLWWNDPDPGDEMVVTFEVPEAGKYKVYAAFTAAKDYGIHRFIVNMTAVELPIDFYSPEVKVMEERMLGSFDLVAGENAMLVLCAGSNPKADPKRHMFGLDYLRLEKLY